MAKALWLRELQQATASGDWIWEGYLRRGSVTLLTSQWKAGKTTLLAVLLARLKGGGELAGRAVKEGKAIVVTEEGPEHWVRRSQLLDFGEHVCWLCRPFRGKPDRGGWLELIEQVAALQREHGLALAVFDPLATFLPGRDENNAGTMLEALLALQRLTAERMAVLLLHHPRKGTSAGGQAARGSGALAGFVDVLLEMNWYGRGMEEDRRRRVTAYSRFAETPRELVLELAADGTDYRSLGDFGSEEFERNWTVLELVLTDARRKLTRRELLAQWPRDEAAPSEATLRRWLERGEALGRVRREGAGSRREPLRYWLAGREQELDQTPMDAMARELEERLTGEFFER